MDLIPIGERLVVRRKEVEKVGSIIIPNTTKQLQATEGVALAVGDECKSVNANDNVFFCKYSGVEIDRDGEKFIIMNEEDVLAIVEKKNE